MIQQCHSWAYIWKTCNLLIQKNTCIAIFMAALFKIAKTRNQPVSINRWTDECIKKWYICTNIKLSHKRRKYCICVSMDGPRDDHMKWSQTNITWYHTWNLKNDTREIIYKIKTDSDIENKLMVTKCKGEEG